MSFSVQVTPDLVTLEPGATTPISIGIVNKDAETDRFEMEIEGLDPEWKAVPVPVFTVDGGETHQEKIFLKPPRASESLAGNYPFVVRIRSLVSGEHKLVQAVAQIKPFHHLSMEINPKKGFVSPTRKQNTFDVTVVNLGNTEHTLQFLGSDPEDACAYEFDQEQVTLGPGAQKKLEVTANPTSHPFFSSGHLIGFTLSARSVESPSIVASKEAQLELRPLVTPTSLALAVLLALILGALYFVMPRPPAVSLSVDPTSVMVGQQITVTWEAEHAKRVIVHAGTDDVYDGPDVKGQRTVTMTQAGQITVSIEAVNGEQRKREARTVTVNTPVPIPPPVIDSLEVTPKRVKLGQPFQIKYSVSGKVTQLLLEPTGQTIDVALDRVEITPVATGEIEYALVAKNDAGGKDRRPFKVTVYDESDAHILDFHPNVRAIALQDGKVTLNWQVTDAIRVEIKAGDAEPVVVDSKGSQDFPMSVKTTFLLTAIDAKNRRATRQVTVSVLPSESPIPDGETTGRDPNGPPTGTPPTTTTGGATTGAGATGNNR